MHLAGIWIYPVKSCKGIAVPSAKITPDGLENDRLWMIVNEKGVFVSARIFSRMVMVVVKLTEDGIELSAPWRPNRTCRVKRIDPDSTTLTPVTVKVWEDTCSAFDCGDDVALWLSETLDAVRIRLVQMNTKHHRRKVDIPLPSQKQELQSDFFTTLTDGYPYTLLSESSLDGLNDSLAEKCGVHPAYAEEFGLPLSLARFRPNFLIAGTQQPYEEDTWAQITIGSHSFRLIKACDRCKIPTIDPEEGLVLPENAKINPITYLDEARNFGRGPLFAQNCVCLNPTGGEIKIKDKVEVVTMRSTEEQFAEKRPVPRT